MIVWPLAVVQHSSARSQDSFDDERLPLQDNGGPKSRPKRRSERFRALGKLSWQAWLYKMLYYVDSTCVRLKGNLRNKSRNNKLSQNKETLMAVT